MNDGLDVGEGDLAAERAGIIRVLQLGTMVRLRDYLRQLQTRARLCDREPRSAEGQDLDLDATNSND
jgi:hypothetical protein